MTINPDLAGMTALSRALEKLRPAGGGYIIGVTGAVACGKSTLSAALGAALAAWPDHPRVERVGTDGFIYPNAVLDARDLTARKGFPESYDIDALRLALRQVREGRAAFPGYSHTTYDVDPALLRWIERPDILIVEGLSLDPGGGPTLVDTLIYIDADEADLEDWFVERFLGFWAEAKTDPTSFYARFRGLDRDQAAALARTVWTQVNLPNLRENIVQARARADIVVHKQADHAIRAVTVSDVAAPR